MLAHCNSDLTVHFHHLKKGLLQLPYEQVISETIKERTVLQIKTALQKKAYEEAGIQAQNSVSNNKIMQGQSGASSAEVTLNALNASESEVDVESLADFGNGGQVR